MKQMLERVSKSRKFSNPGLSAEQMAGTAAGHNVRLTKTDAACCAESVSTHPSSSTSHAPLLPLNGQLYQVVPGHWRLINCPSARIPAARRQSVAGYRLCVDQASG